MTYEFLQKKFLYQALGLSKKENVYNTFLRSITFLYNLTMKPGYSNIFNIKNPIRKDFGCSEINLANM
jgi:hypothetical protein